MTLRLLEVSNLRIVEHASFSPHPQTNLFVGSNASGKTSLLEGIHLLATGRSFRTRQLAEIKRRNCDTLAVRGHVLSRGGEIRAAFEYDEKGRRIAIDGMPKLSNVDLAQLIPVQAVFPGALQEFLQHGHERRRLLDWGLFHMEPRFYPLWRRYRRLLKQRNTALQAGAAARVCAAWDMELASSGEQLHQWRRTYIQQWRQHLATLSRALFDMDSIAVDLIPGWPVELSLREALADTMAMDQRQRYTHVGAQRDDMELRWQGESVRTQCSHGQQRLLFIALKLAHLGVLATTVHKTGVLLIDDLYAELDTTHTERLLLLLTQWGAQSFITTTQHQPLKGPVPGKLFHVERGRLRE